MLVLLVPQQAHLLLGIVLGEPILGRSVAQAEVARQTLDVARRDLDLGVAAAVAGAFAARVLHAHRYRESFCLAHWLPKSSALYAQRMTFLMPFDPFRHRFR